MGACDFSQTAIGKTPQQAFSAAQEDAGWEHGFGGYSGTIVEKHGYVLFTLPPRLSLNKLLGWVNEAAYDLDIDYLKDNVRWTKERAASAEPGTKRAAQAQVKAAQSRLDSALRKQAKLEKQIGEHLPLVREMAKIYDDKWGPAVCIEITSPTQKREHAKWWLQSHGRQKLGRGDRVFFFCGMASS